jgi:hypothetical protein
MGTRGTIRIRVRDPRTKKIKVIFQYNQFDSYHSKLGVDIISELIDLLLTKSIKEIRELFLEVKLVSYKSKPTKDDIKKLKEWTDLDVSEQSTRDWYCLLRNCQGSIMNIVKSGYAMKVMQNRVIRLTVQDEPKSVQEYNYFIDLEEETFYEVSNCSQPETRVALDPRELALLKQKWRD